MSRAVFVDEVDIEVQGGTGGKGCLSFLREKYRPRGRPDGGDGGRGGDVFCEAEAGLNSLAELAKKRRQRAGDGRPGEGNNRHGGNGRELIIQVPMGTVIRDVGGELLADLVETGQRALVASGGNGGRGNSSLANQARPWPHYAELGEEGEKRQLRLELKILADVGIVGLPNAGKSTLLRRISAAKPEVAAYPFTTKAPQLGIVDLTGDEESPVVVADLPGLIEGAHRGAGLGLTFLRHIERTRVLLIVIDLSGQETEPAAAFESLCQELIAYDSSFMEKRGLVVAGNKLDLAAGRKVVDSVRRYFEEKGHDFFPISALTGEGVPALLEALGDVVATLPASPVEEERRVFTLTDEDRISVIQQSDGRFRVKSRAVERMVAKTDFDRDEAVAELQRRLEKMGVESLLVKAGAKQGDVVRIGGWEFDFYPPES